MKYHELINTTLDSVTVKRVYGDPTRAMASPLSRPPW